MSDRHLMAILTLVGLFLAGVPAAYAQGETEGEAASGDEGEADAEDGSDAEDEGEADEDDESEPDADDADEDDEDEDLDEDEDFDDDEDEPMELDPPQTIDLDLSALGDMDPEKDLTGDGVFAEDEAAAQAVESWTERELDILEIHGYFRVRPELYNAFNIRGDNALYHRPMVQLYNDDNQMDTGGNLGEDCREQDGDRRRCKNTTLAGSNMRLRLEPTLNISEEVWVKTQLDLLDNVMMGSTPRYYQNTAAGGEMIEPGRVQGWDMGPPGGSDMIVVRRAWAEVMTPLGQLRFGRMGDHWGLGMLHNAGNGLEQDFGDSVDRLMFAARINDWLIAPAFDFPNEGVSAVDANGRPFDVGQLDDAYQLTGIVAYKHDKEEQAALIKRGDWVINTGIYFSYRWQVLSFENPDQGQLQLAGDDYAGYHFYRRDMWAITPDLWFQFLYDTFHLELEAALIYGEVGNPDRDLADFDQAESLVLLQWGGVLQADYGLLSDQLRIGLEFGFASGDDGVESLRAPGTYDQPNRPGDGTFTAFSFNPSYNTDIILYRHILGSISQTYYFHPWLRYDFLKSAMGKKFGIQADVIYSRAVYEDSTISDNSANIGIELNAQVMYVSEDRFHAGLKYGVLFPLGAFEGEWDDDGDPDTAPLEDYDLAIPQTIQVLLGVTY